MHCTVQPGKYCMLLPPVAETSEFQLARAAEAAKMSDCDAGSQWCQEQTTQDIGVRLPRCGFPVNDWCQRDRRCSLTGRQISFLPPNPKFRSTIILSMIAAKYSVRPSLGRR